MPPVYTGCPAAAVGGPGCCGLASSTELPSWVTTASRCAARSSAIERTGGASGPRPPGSRCSEPSGMATRCPSRTPNSSWDAQLTVGSYRDHGPRWAPAPSPGTSSGEPCTRTRIRSTPETCARVQPSWASSQLSLVRAQTEHRVVQTTRWPRPGATPAPTGRRAGSWAGCTSWWRPPPACPAPEAARAPAASAPGRRPGGRPAAAPAPVRNGRRSTGRTAGTGSRSACAG